MHAEDFFDSRLCTTVRLWMDTDFWLTNISLPLGLYHHMFLWNALDSISHHFQHFCVDGGIYENENKNNTKKLKKKMLMYE